MFYSLKNRLIVFFVVLLLVSFGTMSYLFFTESRSIIRSYIESSAYEKMDEYGSFVNMALVQIYDVSSVVFNSSITIAGITRSLIRLCQRQVKCSQTLILASF